MVQLRSVSVVANTNLSSELIFFWTNSLSMVTVAVTATPLSTLDTYTPLGGLPRLALTIFGV